MAVRARCCRVLQGSGEGDNAGGTSRSGGVSLEC